MIDRERLVRRHNVVLTRWHPSCTLSLGNGDFAVNVDGTGLQTFPEAHELPPRPALVTGPDGVRRLPRLRFDPDDFPVPLRIQSSWGWYATDPGRTHRLEDTGTAYRTRTGTVRYPDRMRLGPDGVASGDAGGWLYANPRRLDLGRIGLRFDPALEVTALCVELDLWTGSVHSVFCLGGAPVEVRTAVHPELDVLATRVRSPLLASGELAVAITFPGQRDPLSPGERLTEGAVSVPGGVERRVGDARYHVRVTTNGRIRADGHVRTSRYLRTGGGAPAEAGTGPGLEVEAPGSELALSAAFSPLPADEPPCFDQVHKAAAEHWRTFWTTGAAVSFAGSTDPRAPELERRVVLSQYQTAVHCAGSAPPQESGLVHNSWGGKFHLEMHWWHAAHFAVWGRPELLERGLGWYREILPAARRTAAEQGYGGARWPKQVGPDGREAPSQVGPFLIWQQPHPIYYAELLRRNDVPGALERHASLVFETAEFMASYAEPDDGGVFHLGPPLVPAQETYYPDRARTADPTFELAYWHWGLHVAQRWRERLGLERHPGWDAVLRRLARPAARQGVYPAVATEPYTVPDDHPSMLMALGFLPATPVIDRAIMSDTFDHVLRTWDLHTTWGWDYPVLAMCATRLGRPEAAVEALLMDTYKNHYLPTGHVPQFPGGLSVYLPANGGLLAAVALMAGRFPPGWRVTAEGLGVFPADLPETGGQGLEPI
ncbi:hypothetical protein [Nonomuraea typhae]|uniref:hypothetical protein n=1 Tax=Nonomuraea typhae TaxID=2603600 RepID=UPI001CA5D642|nr:hypothetical protein [Nonomuraea typhae]